MPVRASVGSRAAVMDRALFPALQRVPAPAAAAYAVSARASSAPAMPREGNRALVVCALWLHIGFIGATAAAAALVLLVGGDAAPLPPLGVAILGGSIAFLAWRRGQRALER